MVMTACLPAALGRLLGGDWHGVKDCQGGWGLRVDEDGNRQTAWHVAAHRLLLYAMHICGADCACVKYIIHGNTAAGDCSQVVLRGSCWALAVKNAFFCRECVLGYAVVMTMEGQFFQSGSVHASK
ncbi:hypothetical protein HaLaN_15925 [Haematococcus lacustris]|uniref:Uncharacterized protein n=1 Tax=Haematococcus lacustris TaxID=44745 RepID=A0A699ZKG5_HAELA|nr:hypothetical protein HaLaN_15925 [Haematococcus lacustris]